RSQCRGWGFESPYLHQSFLSSRPRPSTRALRFSEPVIQMSTSGPEAEGMAGRIEHDAQAAVVAVRRLVLGFRRAAFDRPCHARSDVLDPDVEVDLHPLRVRRAWPHGSRVVL